MSRKRRRLSPADDTDGQTLPRSSPDDSTEFKLAVLASLHPDLGQDILLDALANADGSVDKASNHLSGADRTSSPAKKQSRTSTVGYQSSLSSFGLRNGSVSPVKKQQLTKRGKTLHLYAPEDIEQHTPCSIIHNFLSKDLADALLHEILPETSSFTRDKFKLFDKVVESPHTMAFYVDSLDELHIQKTEYVYNGSYVSDVRQSLPVMLQVSSLVKEAVNREIQRRIKEFSPDGEKLRYQSSEEWKPNAAFVNCYDGGKESVGYHSDQLTYLGPRAIIGSLSLGVAREFRVRKIVAHDDDNTSRADHEGQIAIHLPHNSLLVMHAEMQEEWKHSIAPALAIDPHPVAENKRINITYRCYKEAFHPKHTPKCRCGIPCVLRCVQRKAGNRGRYMWMCHANYTPGKVGCGFFVWASFDDDGNPPWWKGKGEEDGTTADAEKDGGKETTDEAASEIE